MNRNEMGNYYKTTISLCRALVIDVTASYANGLTLLADNIANGSQDLEGIAALREALTGVLAGIVPVGQHLVQSLQLWQEHGATVEELCELCGAKYKKLKRRIPANAGFADIIREYQLDFKDAGKRTPTWQDDAPLTLAVLAADDIKRIQINAGGK